MQGGIKGCGKAIFEVYDELIQAMLDSERGHWEVTLVHMEKARKALDDVERSCDITSKDELSFLNALKNDFDSVIRRIRETQESYSVEDVLDRSPLFLESPDYIRQDYMKIKNLLINTSDTFRLFARGLLRR